MHYLYVKNMDMELRQFRYFAAVAEESHITRAAERLGIQQPPLSQQIKALEEELGIQLFRRKPRGVELTDAGKAFYSDARDILERVENALVRAKRTARGEQGRLSVGFTSSAPHNPIVPGLIREFQRAWPGVSLELVEDGTGILAEAVQAERIDVAFVRSNIGNAEGLRILPAVEEPMVAAIPADHALASEKEPISLSRFRDAPFILYRRQSGPGLFDAIVGACARAGFNPDIVQEAPQIVSTLNLVAAGIGVSFVPQSLSALAMPGVRFLAVRARPALIAPLYLACRRVDYSEPAKNFTALWRSENENRKT